MGEHDGLTITAPLRAYIAGLAVGGGESFKGIVRTLTELADEIDGEYERAVGRVMEDHS